MRKLMLIITIATMAVVANAQNKVTTAKTTPEMVYYYTSFNVVRMRETLKGKDVYVPSIGDNKTNKMNLCKDNEGKIIYFDVPLNAFNWITSQGWEFWNHDDNYNAIQRWVIRRKVTKEQLNNLIAEDIETSNNIESIPSAVEELQRMVK